ncbi:MAG: ABC transporter ATP-binding protein [Thermoguttaceae bacterium]|nr:ABC transporter ATP-binding protein [Thermoguttaceae bacterium]
MVVSDLHKGYQMGKKKVPVLRGVNLTVHKGEFLAVVGQSGSGKSTLLHLMGTLDTPDSGTIYFDGQRIDNLSIGQRDVLRNHFIGMIFQFYHLLPELTVFENVLAPLMIRDSVLGYLRKKRQYAREAEELLNLVGLSHRLKHRPNELSGGEMQRASIARALISNPHLLLADEPTGNLDSKASIGVLELLRELNEKKKLTVVMVTHDLGQAQDADRAIRIVDGQVVHESRS